MKKTIEIVKEVGRLMKIEVNTSGSQKLTDDFDYLASQFRILDYILMEQTLPENMEPLLLDMYDAVLQECKGIGPNEALCAPDDKKKLGAADILAWVLDISKKAHKKNKKKGSAN